MTTLTRAGDIATGTAFRGRSVTIGEAHVVTFAGLTGDFHPLHMDAQTAQAAGFGRRIAHGWLTWVVGAGAIAEQLAHWDVVAALGGGPARFRAPVFLGDTITPTATVSGVDERAGRAVVTLDVEIANQDGETVVSSSIVVMVAA